MISIPVARKDNTYDVFIVMGNENLRRIVSHDPAEMDTLKLGHPWNTMKLRTVVMMFGTDEEREDLLKCKNHKDVQDALKKLSRGFKYRPEMGDHDGPYYNIKGPTN